MGWVEPLSQREMKAIRDNKWSRWDVGEVARAIPDVLSNEIIIYLELKEIIINEAYIMFHWWVDYKDYCVKAWLGWGSIVEAKANT